MILIGIIVVPLASILPHKSSYMLLYTNPKNTLYTIEVIHNHTALKTWNELKYIKRYNNLGFWIEKDFEQSKLEGKWIVYDDNPYCTSKGLTNFKNGNVVYNGN